MDLPCWADGLHFVLHKEYQHNLNSPDCCCCCGAAAACPLPESVIQDIYALLEKRRAWTKCPRERLLVKFANLLIFSVTCCCLPNYHYRTFFNRLLKSDRPFTIAEPQGMNVSKKGGIPCLMDGGRRLGALSSSTFLTASSSLRDWRTAKCSGMRIEIGSPMRTPSVIIRKYTLIPNYATTDIHGLMAPFNRSTGRYTCASKCLKATPALSFPHSPALISFSFHVPKSELLACWVG